MTPTFIRYFCQTDGAPGPSELAWAFMRRMIRFRPVLVASITGPVMGGRWIGYESLRITPQLGSFVNVVCCAPERWTWLARVPAPTTQLTAAELAAGDDSTVETIMERQELWTAKVRNVLIVPSVSGIGAAQIETAKKYDIVVSTTPEMQAALTKLGVDNILILHPYPEEAVRGVVLAQRFSTRPRSE